MRSPNLDHHSSDYEVFFIYSIDFPFPSIILLVIFIMFLDEL